MRVRDCSYSPVCEHCVKLCLCSVFRADPRSKSKERYLLTMDGEACQIGIIMSEAGIKLLQATGGEAVIGAANASRLHNAADAGGVFWGPKLWFARVAMLTNPMKASQLFSPPRF